MEDDQQTGIVGIAENLLVELHHRLLVATEEIDLDTQNACVVHPFHLLLATCSVVHDTFRRLRSIVPRAIGIVPQIESHALRLSIACQLSDTLIAYLLVPKGINEHRAVAHSRREVDVAFLFIEIATGIHANDPRPGALSIFILT